MTFGLCLLHMDSNFSLCGHIVSLRAASLSEQSGQHPTHGLKWTEESCLIQRVALVQIERIARGAALAGDVPELSFQPFVLRQHSRSVLLQVELFHGD